MSTKEIDWEARYDGYLDMLGRIVSGETYVDYSSNVTTIIKAVRAVAAMDAKNPEIKRPRYFMSFKALVSGYLDELSKAPR